MNILGVQIIAVLFAIFMLYVNFLYWKSRALNNLDFLAWNILWVGFIFLALFPGILQNITKLLFFARVMDLLMVSAFMILAFIGFQNYTANRKMEKIIEYLVRKEALKPLVHKVSK